MVFGHDLCTSSGPLDSVHVTVWIGRARPLLLLSIDPPGRASSRSLPPPTPSSLHRSKSTFKPAHKTFATSTASSHQSNHNRHQHIRPAHSPSFPIELAIPSPPPPPVSPSPPLNIHHLTFGTSALAPSSLRPPRCVPHPCPWTAHHPLAASPTPLPGCHTARRQGEEKESPGRSGRWCGRAVTGRGEGHRLTMVGVARCCRSSPR